MGYRLDLKSMGFARQPSQTSQVHMDVTKHYHEVAKHA